jgi:hypothetical protein
VHSSPENSDSPQSQEAAGRVESLATWVVEIEARLRAAELQTGDEKTAKELRRAIEALAKHDPKLETRLTNRVDVLADRLTTLASAVSTTAASVAGKDGDIASLKRELGESAERIHGVVRELGRTARTADVDELRAALQTLAAERSRPTGEQRIDELGAKVDYFSERLDTLAKTVATTASGLAGRDGDVAVLRQRLEESSLRVEQAVAELRQLHGESALAERIHALESGLERATTDHARRQRDITALRGRIDEAYGHIGSVISDLQRLVVTVSSRVESIEQLPSLTAQAFAQHSAELSARMDALGERLVAELSERQKTTESESGETRRLLAEVASRLDSVEREGAARNDDPSDNPMAQLSVLIDGLRMRLAASEQTLAAVVGSQRTGARLSGDGQPAVGDGRFRLELRALELRMELAEAAAREDRETIFVQLERLASRIDWRLQRLEAEELGAFTEVAGGGALFVPIRGGDV